MVDIVLRFEDLAASGLRARFTSERSAMTFGDASDEELLDMIAAWVGRRVMHYAAAMNGGDAAEGERTARSIAGIAAATVPAGCFGSSK